MIGSTVFFNIFYASLQPIVVFFGRFAKPGIKAGRFTKPDLTQIKKKS